MHVCLEAHDCVITLQTRLNQDMTFTQGCDDGFYPNCYHSCLQEQYTSATQLVWNRFQVERLTTFRLSALQFLVCPPSPPLGLCLFWTAIELISLLSSPSGSDFERSSINFVGAPISVIPRSNSECCSDCKDNGDCCGFNANLTHCILYNGCPIYSGEHRDSAVVYQLTLSLPASPTPLTSMLQASLCCNHPA